MRSGDRNWSLAGRLTRLYLVSTSCFVLAIAVASALFLQRGVESEVDQLVREEVAEMQAAFRTIDPFDSELFRSMTQDLAHQHPENPLAWRVWPADGGAPIEEGRARLLGALPPSRDLVDTLVRGEDGLRALSTRLNDGTVVGLVLDGSAQMRLLRRYVIVASGVVLACLLASALLARMVFRQVTTLLRQVADQAARMRVEEAQDVPGIPGAPLEIQAVSAALLDLQARIRREAEEARVFTAGLAHELRSPVQNLIGETEVALLSPRANEAYRELLQSHLDELRQLGDAIDNLVTISSRGRDRRAGAREEFDVAEEVEIRLRRDRFLADRSGVRLEVAAEGDTRVSGDREAILRALRNLIQNAIQWSPSGSRVAVRIEGGAGEVTITVDDAGPGVAPDLRERIFDPFFRGPAALGRRVGYGLGLALVRGAAEDHGGAVTVGDSPLGGARFCLTVPREPARSRAA